MSDGSLFKVPLTKILKLEPHLGGDRLEIATVYGFQVVVQKGRYSVDSVVIYVPIDSILPQELEDKIFSKDSKITLNKHRVRQISIRGFASAGMLIDPEELKYIFHHCVDESLLEVDFSNELKITKYEPVRKQGTPKRLTPRNRPLENSRLHKYGGVTNLKWLPTFFDDKEVTVQLKLHGSNCRASYSRTEPNTLWKKFLKLINLLPKYEYCYGSNNVQLQERKTYTGFYNEDIYGNVLKKVDAFNKLKPGETVFGELIGEGVQANYHYGHKEHHFVLFDVKKEREDGTQEYLDPEEVEAFALERGFDFVPVLYRGIFDLEKIKQLATGPDDYYPEHKVKEGVVVKLRKGYGKFGSKHALKIINEDYLADSTNSDDH